MNQPTLSTADLNNAPLALGVTAPAQTFALRTDDDRQVDVTYFPAQGANRGAVLFSHGLRSAPKHYVRLFETWSMAGYDVYAPLHIDSAEYPDYEHYPQEASWPARLYDMRATAKMMARERYVAAGHSYGALVALTLGGATATAPSGFQPDSIRDPHVIGVLALSPPGVIPGLISPDGYNTLAVPTLVQTGDRDSFVPEIPWQSHLIPYENAPAGNIYSLVLTGVDHGFGGLIYDPIMFALSNQQAQLDEAIRLSTLFLDAFGAKDSIARSQLDQLVGKPGMAQLGKK